MISPQVFFNLFKILIFWVFKGIKGQKMVQNDKKFSVTLHISGTIYRMIFIIVHMRKMISPFFGSLEGKRLKISENDRKLWPSDSITQEPYIIWLSFMDHMCKMIISPGIFFQFFKFCFFGILRGKRAKNSPKWQIILSVVLDISETCIMWLSFMLHMCKMITSAEVKWSSV